MEDGKVAKVDMHAASSDGVVAPHDATPSRIKHPRPDQTLNVFLVVAALFGVATYAEVGDLHYSPAARVFLAITFGLSILMLVVGATLSGNEHRHVALYMSTCYIFIAMVTSGSVAYILLAIPHEEDAHMDSTSKAVAGIVGGFTGLSLSAVVWVQLRNNHIV